MTLLVVDDDEGVLRFVRTFLERDGHSVIPARNGSEGLEVARSRGGQFDVLLTDIRMPGLDGRELADAVKRLYPRVRVIYMTGYADEEFAPGTAALRKPFLPNTLRETVRRS